MIEMVFQIKVNWRVFVLEDARPRIEWFKARIPEATYSNNAEDAISILSNHSHLMWYSWTMI